METIGKYSHIIEAPALDLPPFIHRSGCQLINILNVFCRLLATYQNSIIDFLEMDPVLQLVGNKDDEYYISRNNAKLITVPSFLDYINAGLDMNLVAGVDFTASNGDPNTANSLHNINGGMNQYMSAIHEVSKILLNFDTDKEVPLFGFGAVLPGGQGAKH